MHGRGRRKQETNSFSSTLLYCLALALVASCVDPYGLLACNLALCGRLWWAHSTLIDRSQLLWLVETGRPEQAGRPAGRPAWKEPKERAAQCTQLWTGQQLVCCKCNMHLSDAEPGRPVGRLARPTLA